MEGLANIHFQQSVSSSNSVKEETSYLEMLSYSVSFIHSQDRKS